MKYLLISMKDRAIDAFMPCGNARAEGEALRVFKDMIGDRQTPQGQHPDDYDMYVVGLFNDQTGEIEPTIPPRKIADGKAFDEMIDKE